jgi:hypothetical protein
VADSVAVAALSSTGAQSSWSLANYQLWQMANGYIPVAQALPQHPGSVAAAAVNQANGLSRQWTKMLSSTDSLLSAGSLDSVVRSLRKEGFPGEARASMTGGGASASATAGTDGEGSPLETAAEKAASSIREATAVTIGQQWRQTVALLDHHLSRQILTSSIETSISASKELNDGLDSLLRG